MFSVSCHDYLNKKRNIFCQHHFVKELYNVAIKFHVIKKAIQLQLSLSKLFIVKTKIVQIIIFFRPKLAIYINYIAV